MLVLADSRFYAAAVIGGFRILGGSEASCILGSIWETNKLQGVNPSDTLRLAFEDKQLHLGYITSLAEESCKIYSWIINMSISTFLLQLPPWLAVLVIVGPTILISIVGFLVVHRFIPVKIRHLHNDVAGAVYATIGVTYAVLLAFVVLVVWEGYNEVEINVENESSIAWVLYRAIEEYPNPKISQEMQQALATYAQMSLAEHRQIVELTGLRAVAGYRTSSLHPITHIMAEVAPRNSHEEILYNLILNNLSELNKYRNLRLYAAEKELPSSIWLAVIVGTIITIGFTYLFGTENVWAHVTIITLLATMSATIIYVVIEIDHPFVGPVSIEPPQAYKRIIEAVNAKKSSSSQSSLQGRPLVASAVLAWPT